MRPAPESPPRLRVLHVVPAVAPRYGGPSVAAMAMARSLAAMGHEVLLATTDADGESRLGVPLEVRVRHEGVDAVFFRRRFGESLKAAEGLATWLEGNVRSFDLVHVHAVFSDAPVRAGRACRRAGVPYVLRPLGTLEAWSLARHRWRKRLFWELGARALVEGASRIHYTSSAEESRTELPAPRPAGVVIPLGVPDALLEACAAPERRVVVLARLHPKKGLELLIDAFAAVAPKRPGWRLLVAGSGDPGYEAALRKRAASSGAPVELLGWVDGERKVELLRTAGLVALTSHQENFALSVAEAMALGCPVLCTETVGLAGEVRECGAGWVVPGRLEDVSAALEEALSAGEERARRGAAGRRWARDRFRWPAIAARLVALYAEIREGEPRLRNPPS